MFSYLDFLFSELLYIGHVVRAPFVFTKRDFSACTPRTAIKYTHHPAAHQNGSYSLSEVNHKANHQGSCKSATKQECRRLGKNSKQPLLIWIYAYWAKQIFLDYMLFMQEFVIFVH